MLQTFDVSVYQILVSLHTPLLNWLWVFLAQYGIYLVALLSLYILFKQKGIARRLSFLFQTLLVFLLARGLVTETIAFFYGRPRPFETGLASLYTHGGADSFPSGHTVAMFGFAFVLYAWNKKAGRYAFVLAALSGVSRAIAGVHWISDIVGGFLVAWIVYVLLRKFVFRKFVKKEEKEEIETAP
jgi:undecaprenyl-diphosphatase